MLREQGLAIVAAACAALAGGQVVRAADAVAATPRFPLYLQDMPTTGPATPPAPTPASPAPVTPSGSPDATNPTPLMGLLGRGHLDKPFTDAGISITGYVEGGYEYNFSAPVANISSDRAFDVRHDSPELDQVELMVSKAVDTSKPFDFGFNFENIYGTDTPFFHSNGLTLVSYGKAPLPFGVPIRGPGGTVVGAGGNVSTTSPRAQYDLTQANFTLQAGKVGFEGGKFATLLGYELINPTTNPFYTHSFIFVNEPYTNTGALGIVNLNDMLTFQGGITRGWDQATEDTNGDIDFIGQLKAVMSKDLTVFLSGITGNEEPDVPAGFTGHNGWRTVIDAVATYAVADQFTIAANGMYGWEAQTGNAGNGGGTGQWYAAAGYATYKLSDYVSINARGEWFNDPDGAAPTQFGPFRRPNQYYEATLGTTIHPAPNDALLKGFFIRPEGRFDYADKATFDPIAGAPTDHYFFTFAIDGVFTF